MDWYKDAFRPLLFHLDPEVAHKLTLRALSHAGSCTPALRFLRSQFCFEDTRLSQQICALTFPNPVILAAGMVKDPHPNTIRALEALGFGGTESGTTTPSGQVGHKRPRLFRITDEEALVNHMGQGNFGAEAAFMSLSGFKSKVPHGITIAPRNWVTTVEDAVEDYAWAFEVIYDVADYITLSGESCPNVSRSSSDYSHYLSSLLGKIRECRESLAASRGAYKPVMLKLPAHLEYGTIQNVVELCLKFGIDGITAVNSSRSLAQERGFDSGGYSGPALFEECLRTVSLVRQLSPELTIIACGGITEANVFEIIFAGANLVAAYTGFVYAGPAFAANLCRGLISGMRDIGACSIAQIHAIRGLL